MSKATRNHAAEFAEILNSQGGPETIRTAAENFEFPSDPLCVALMMGDLGYLGQGLGSEGITANDLRWVVGLEVYFRRAAAAMKRARKELEPYLLSDDGSWR